MSKKTLSARGDLWNRGEPMGVPEQRPKSEAAMADPLELEMKTYKALLPSLLADEGRFAVICGDKLVGIFDAYADALKAGYEHCGVKPFLVKKISSEETIAYFTRDLVLACRT